MSALTLPTCDTCTRQLHEGEDAWADDVKVIEPRGVRLVTRYICDDCAEVTA